MVHAVPKGVQLPSRHLYLLERLEDKVAAVNTRINTWQQWLAAALAAQAAAAAAAAGGGSAEGSGGADGSIEWAPVGAPVQVRGACGCCCGFWLLLWVLAACSWWLVVACQRALRAPVDTLVHTSQTPAHLSTAVCVWSVLVLSGCQHKLHSEASACAPWAQALLI
jgi:hypothetical protein